MRRDEYQGWGVSCRQYLAVFLLTIILLVGGCARQGSLSGMEGAGKSDGLPTTIENGSFQQGLTAVYFDQKFRHVDEMPSTERGIEKYGRRGKPILKLDHQFGRRNVFGSGRNEGVGVLMRGYLHLDRAGEYQFKAKSNDGFQLYIDGNLIVSDPDIHGDRVSQPGSFSVVQGGMFPVTIKYFQRKGTAMLQLFWIPAGASYYAIVPGGIYAHIAR